MTTASERGAGLLDALGDGLAVGLGAAVGAQVGLRAGIWRDPRPMPAQMAGWLDHPWRRRYRNPGALLGLFGLFNGMQVADLGCGTGLFTVEMARKVGQTGTVHAVDLHAPLLAQTQRRAAAAAGIGCIRSSRMSLCVRHCAQSPDARRPARRSGRSRPRDRAPSGSSTRSPPG